MGTTFALRLKFWAQSIIQSRLSWALVPLLAYKLVEDWLLGQINDYLEGRSGILIAVASTAADRLTLITWVAIPALIFFLIAHAYVESRATPPGVRALSAEPAPSKPTRSSMESLFVDYDNARWQFGGFYYGSNGKPYSKPPVCPVHLSGLFYEEKGSRSGREAPGARTYQHLKDAGQLWCPEPQPEGHRLGPHRSATYKEMREYAEAQLLGELNRWKLGN